MRAAVNTLLMSTAIIVLVLLSCFYPGNTWAQSGETACTPSLGDAYAVRSDAISPNAIGQANWERVTIPDHWNERWPAHSNVVWYRVDWHVHCQDENPRQPLAVLISAMNMAGQVWFNNQLLWTDANLSEPLSRSWNSPRFLSLPNQSVNYAGTNQLYFRITGDALSTPGLGKVSVGNTQNIIAEFNQATWHQRSIFHISLILSITLGTVCGFIWLFRRQEVAYGWYALATVFWVCFAANILLTETAPFTNSASFIRFNVASFSAYIFCFCIFSWRFLNKAFPQNEKFFFMIMLLFVASIWLLPDVYLPITLQIVFLTSVLILSVNSLFVSYFCFRTRQLESWLLGATLIGCLIIGMLTVLTVFQVINGFSNALPYTSLLFASFLCIILAMRLSKSLWRIEHFNEELTQKIQSAETKLATTLNHRHALTVKNNQLKERMDLAHELHDGLGSSLVRAMTQVSYAKDTLSNKHTLSILSLLRNDLRQIIDNFSESQLKLPATPIYWLAPLRNRFVQIFDDMDIHLQWEVDQQWRTPPSAMQCLTLYRVAEESLTNVIKHSQASEVNFRCLVKEDVVELQIIDNGVGFNTVDIHQCGIGVGMQSMRTRIERLAGVLEIQSKPGETSIVARAPYELKH